MAEGKVAKNTAYLMSAFVGQKLLALVYFMIVARLAGVEGTGKYVIATAFASMFAVMMDLGLGNVLVREVAKERNDAQRILSDVLGIKLALSGFFLVIVTAAAWGMGYSPELRLMIAVASLAMVMESVQVALYSVIRGFQNLRPEAMGVIIGQLLVLAAGTLLFLVWHSPLALVTALALNTAWNVGWAGYVLHVRYGLSLRPRLERAPMRALALLAAPFALAAVFSRVYSYVDQVMLSHYVTAAQSGLYGAANKLTFAFSFLPSALAASLYPAMSEYWHRDRSHLSEVYASAFKYLLIIATPISFGMFALAQPFAPLIFGHEFADAYLPLRVLVFSLIFTFLYVPTGSLLNACDRQALNTVSLGVAMTASVTLNYLLLRHYGAMGAATANLASNALLLVVSMTMAWPVIRPVFARTIRSAFSVLTAGAAMWLVVREVYPMVGLFPTVAIGAPVYALALLGLRAVTRQEAMGLINLFFRRRSAPSDMPTV